MKNEWVGWLLLILAMITNAMFIAAIGFIFTASGINFVVLIASVFLFFFTPYLWGASQNSAATFPFKKYAEYVGWYVILLVVCTIIAIVFVGLPR